MEAAIVKCLSHCRTLSTARNGEFILSEYVTLGFLHDILLILTRIRYQSRPLAWHEQNKLL